jgi:ribonuclease P protein component
VTASVPEASNQAGKARAKFPRSLRLLRHADFERVYRTGRRYFSASLTVFYAVRQSGPGMKISVAHGLRVGFTVGRALGGAVERNRMKRRLREAVRLSSPPAEIEVDVVINPKKSLLSADFDAVLNEVRRAFVVVKKNSCQLPVAGCQKNTETRASKPQA